jgi:hypothetical protein
MLATTGTAALLALAGCTPGSEGGKHADSADTDDHAGDDSGDTDTAAPLPDGAAVVADLSTDLDGTLLAVSGDGGWPVQVTDGWLFVTTEPGAWNLAGEFDGWAGEPMTEAAGFSWIVEPVGAPTGYKFTDGTAWNADPWSRQYTYDDNGEMSLLLATDAHLERLFAVGDDAMAPRTVRAWVPASTATHVLYVADGQNLFDPDAFWGGWHLQDVAPDAMLLVGIDNTDARMDEYTHVPDVIDGTTYGGQADAYADFVEDTVRPLVAATWGEPGTVGLMGSSLGGLVSFAVADRYPGEFAFAASLSGTMGWGSIGATNETMIQRYAAAGHRGTALYLDSGGSGGSCADADGDGTNDDDPTNADNYCENIQLRDVLSAEGYTFDTDLWHWWEPDAQHNEAEWAARVWRPLDLFAGL